MILMMYIHEINEVEGVEAYYGPFNSNEAEIRINDAYADMLEAFGGRLEVVYLSKNELDQINYISPPEFWMTQLANLS